MIKIKIIQSLDNILEFSTKDNSNRIIDYIDDIENFFHIKDYEYKFIYNNLDFDIYKSIHTDIVLNLVIINNSIKTLLKKNYINKINHVLHINKNDYYIYCGYNENNLITINDIYINIREYAYGDESKSYFCNKLIDSKKYSIILQVDDDGYLNNEKYNHLYKINKEYLNFIDKFI